VVGVARAVVFDPGLRLLGMPILILIAVAGISLPIARQPT
jgi:hypothetical protein